MKIIKSPFSYVVIKILLIVNIKKVKSYYKKNENGQDINIIARKTICLAVEVSKFTLKVVIFNVIFELNF